VAKRTAPAASAPGAAAPGAAADKTTIVSRFQAGDAITKRHKDLLPALVKALADSDKDVVQAVTAALGSLGAEAVPSLVAILQSPEPLVRARGAAALGKMGPAGQQGLGALVKALQDQTPEVRREAARAIALILRDASALPGAAGTDIPATPRQGNGAAPKKN
jgi:HEAT repeat protein